MKEVFILKTIWNKRSLWVKLGASFGAPARGYTHTVITARFKDVSLREQTGRWNTNAELN